MKKIILYAGLFIFGITTLFGQEKEVKVGADSDIHGCIGSAGYTYSELKNDCIRIFEQKIRLKELASNGNYIAAIVFDVGKKRVELFLKEEKKSSILNRSGNKIWKNTVYCLIENKGFVLTKNGRAIYKL